MRWIVKWLKRGKHTPVLVVGIFLKFHISCRLKARANRKRATKKRTLMDRTSTGGGLQRARLMRMASNNVYEYALDLGLDRDAVEQLERQYRSSRNTVKDCVEKVQLGFEVRLVPNFSKLSWCVIFSSLYIYI